MAKHEIITTIAFTKLGFTMSDLDDLEELASRNEYWQSALDFVGDLIEKDVKELSARQIAWAAKILDQLEEQRRKGRI